MESWLPLFKPSILRFMALGMAVTLEIASIAIALSLVFGTALAILRHERFRLLSTAATVYIEGVRSLPSFLIVIYTYFALYRSGYDFPAVASIVVALTIYHSSKVAEIVRGGLKAVPGGHREAGLALGLGYPRLMWHIVLPQALRRAVPPLISELIVVVKNTTLGSLLGVNEILYRAVLVHQQYRNPLEAFTVVAVAYFLINSLLSMLGRYLERGDVSDALGARLQAD